MFQLTDQIKEKLIPYARILIDDNLDSIEIKTSGGMIITLIKVSQAQKAYEQGLVLSYPIEMHDEEFLVLRRPVKE